MAFEANQLLLGWLLLASGIVFITSFISLALMFSVKIDPWGPLNDITYVLALILILPFLVAYFAVMSRTQPLMALAALLLGGVGIGLITYTQVGLVLRKIEFSLNLKQGAFGAGLLGIAFIINHWMGAGIISNGLNRLGLAAGFLMGMGLPTGLFYGKEELEMTTGKLEWKTVNPLAVISILAAFLGQVLLIILVFSLGFQLV